MTETYLLMLPMPGGDRECVLELSREGRSLRGTVTNPHKPGERCPIYEGTITGNQISLKADVGRIQFVFSGTVETDALRLDFTTHETIPLEPGKRISGESGKLEGEYLVGVYSPGGVKENHFVITRNGDGYGGEMFCLMDQKTLDFMEKMMAGGPPADVPGDMPPMKLPKLGDKCDVNPFLSVTGDENAFEITTKTGSGSLFVFAGSVAGDEIGMTLHVTDFTPGLTAGRV